MGSNIDVSPPNNDIADVNEGPLTNLKARNSSQLLVSTKHGPNERILLIRLEDGTYIAQPQEPIVQQDGLSPPSPGVGSFVTAISPSRFFRLANDAAVPQLPNSDAIVGGASSPCRSGDDKDVSIESLRNEGFASTTLRHAKGLFCSSPLPIRRFNMPTPVYDQLRKPLPPINSAMSTTGASQLQENNNLAKSENQNVNSRTQSPAGLRAQYEEISVLREEDATVKDNVRAVEEVPGQHETQHLRHGSELRSLRREYATLSRKVRIFYFGVCLSLL